MSTFPRAPTNESANESLPASNAEEQYFRPPTPPPPSYSPITPELPNAIPATIAPTDVKGEVQHQQYDNTPGIPQSYQSGYGFSIATDSPLQTMAQPLVKQTPPPPAPLDLATNPDAIALRAAMSILQLQRQQALSDMQTLESQKEAALSDLEGFAQAAKTGRISSRGTKGILAPNEERRLSENATQAIGEESSKLLEGAGDVPIEDSLEDSPSSVTMLPKSSTYDQDPSYTHDVPIHMQERLAQDGFPAMVIPAPQNVVRMPPINWAKYHVIGESLDRLHREQQAAPTPGIPQGAESDFPSGALNNARKDTVVAAPYDPFTDVLEYKGHEEPTNAALPVFEPICSPKVEVGVGKARRKSGGPVNISGEKRGR